MLFLRCTTLNLPLGCLIIGSCSMCELHVYVCVCFFLMFASAARLIKILFYSNYQMALEKQFMLFIKLNL